MEKTATPTPNREASQELLKTEEAQQKNPHALITQVNTMALEENEEASACEDCHEDEGSVAAADYHTGEAVHQGFECVRCHDPASTAASCTNSACHTGILVSGEGPPATPSGGHTTASGPFCGGQGCHPQATAAAARPQSIHNSRHAQVSCAACHDAGSAQAGPGPDGGPWVSWRTIDQDGTAQSEPYFSHQIQAEVDCRRCHFNDNPWDLPQVNRDEFSQ
jgi:hypothetical protein